METEKNKIVLEQLSFTVDDRLAHFWRVDVKTPAGLNYALESGLYSTKKKAKARADELRKKHAHIVE